MDLSISAVITKSQIEQSSLPLPNEITSMILNFLPVEDLDNVSRVCRSLKIISMEIRTKKLRAEIKKLFSLKIMQNTKFYSKDSKSKLEDILEESNHGIFYLKLIKFLRTDLYSICCSDIDIIREVGAKIIKSYDFLKHKSFFHNCKHDCEILNPSVPIVLTNHSEVEIEREVEIPQEEFYEQETLVTPQREIRQMFQGFQESDD